MTFDDDEGDDNDPVARCPCCDTSASNEHTTADKLIYWWQKSKELQNEWMENWLKNNMNKKKEEIPRKKNQHKTIQECRALCCIADGKHNS